jgi:hypothetical protein
MFFLDHCLSFCPFSFSYCIVYFFDLRLLFTSLVSSNLYLEHLCKRFSIFNKNRISYQYARCYSGMPLTNINDAMLTGRLMITVEQYQMLYLISFYLPLLYTFANKLSLL